MTGRFFVLNCVHFWLNLHSLLKLLEISFKVFSFEHFLDSYQDTLNEQYQFLLPLLEPSRPMSAKHLKTMRYITQNFYNYILTREKIYSHTALTGWCHWCRVLCLLWDRKWTCTCNSYAVHAKKAQLWPIFCGGLRNKCLQVLRILRQKQLPRRRAMR